MNRSTGIVLALGLVGAIAPLPAVAQIMPDTTLGRESSRVTGNVTVRGGNGDRIDGGAARGSNLFHSFSDFNVNDGQRVYFSNPAGITNILSRVTGNTRSDIMGTLGVDGSANLFLLNPNGIIFGPNAQLDISGSFTASTADSIAFPDGTQFSASTPGDPALLSVAVPLGVQYGATPPGSIANAGNLSVGQNLQLTGSSVTSTGQLSAPTGQLLVEGVAGDVQVRQAVAQTATLTASNNLILQESQLQTTGDLNLQAGNTVQIRDSVTNPFVAYAGENLTVQGNQNVDIFALNHPSSGLVSGRDMVLRSANTVGGDAHYWSGGNFRIEQLDGSLGNLFSPYDPVIRTAGNVEFQSYQGASLQILAGGSVTIEGDIIIDAPDNGSFQDSVRLVDPLGRLPDEIITINSSEQTLDIRSGVTIATPIEPPFPIPGMQDNDGSYLDGSPGSDIRIGSITNKFGDGQVFLQSAGSVVFTNTAGIPASNLGNYSIVAFGNPVTISAQRDVQIPQGIITASGIGTSQNITIFSGGNIDISNTQRPSLFSAANQGNSGGILLSTAGNITTGDLNSSVIVPARPRPQPQPAEDPPVYGDPGPRPIPVPINPPPQIPVEIESGQAGTVNLAAAGDIIIGSINTSLGGRRNGNAGNITISGNTITSGNISSNASGTGSGELIVGQAGTITLTAFQDITTGSINTSLGENRQGSAGNITLDSGNTITPRGDISSGALGIGNGGSITILANNKIELDRIVISSNVRTDNRQGSVFPGNITIQADNTIQLNSGSQISTQVGRGGQGAENRGDITITANNLNLTDRSQINSFLNDNYYGDPTSPAPQGRAGDITINLLNNGSITINGSNASPDYPTGIFSSVGNGTIHRTGLGDASGTGGNITLNLGSGSLTITGDPGNATAGIAAKTFAIGDAGSINITGNGSITVQNGGFLDNSTDSRGFVNGTSTPRSGNAGAISVTADSITLMNDDLARRAIQSSVQAPDPNGDSSVARGSSGVVTITANSLTINNAAISSEINETDNSTGQSYRGGDILISTPIIGIGSSLPNRLNGRGQPADGIIAATTGGNQAGSVTVETERLTISGNARVYAGTSSSGAGGFVALRPSRNARSLTVNLNSNSQISASTSGAGPGGNLSIAAPDSVRMTGGGTLTVETTGEGSAGDLSIATRRLAIQGGTRVSAEALGTSRAGNVTVNAQEVTVEDDANISASNVSSQIPVNERALFGNVRLQGLNTLVVNSGGKITASTQTGQAGGVAIDARNSVTVRGAGSRIAAEATEPGGNAGGVSLQGLDALLVSNGGEITASTQTGQAGNVAIDADDSIEISGRNSRLAVEATESGGVAGNLNLTTDDLTIRDGAEATVSSRGVAGNLTINANSIELNNGRLTAIARSGNEGNININMSGTLFQLYNRSRVTAGAENQGNGGSVNIDASNGFVLANPYGNSDILANANRGSGGDITITTNAIFGLEERAPSPLSDINADSQFSTSGSITLNTLNVDPTRGLGELPVDIVDTTSLVADGCVGSNRSGVTDQGEFTRTGRGGLSPSPNAPLTSDAAIAPLATLAPNETPSGSASIPNAPHVQPLVEAQGLGLNAEGKVSLMASSSVTTSPAVEQSSACSVH